jgi:FtsP/CotA-like multicopper oxidase with cupredoxin domain
VNGQIFDPDRVDARVERGSSEIWTFLNPSTNWHHPIHSHLIEFLLLQVNSLAFTPVRVETMPLDEFKRLSQSNEDIIQAGNSDQFGEQAQPNSPVGRVIDVFMGGRRRDIATLTPSEKLVVYVKFDDFFGKYVMLCQNAVHQDHGMMVRWDVVELGDGDSDNVVQRRLQGINR